MTQQLSSMTGYAQGRGTAVGHSFQIDIRGVNARGLDLRLRMPSGFEEFEAYMRKQAASRLSRGAVSISILVQREESHGRISINEQALASVLEAARRLSEEYEITPASADGLLGLKGVIETAETKLDDDERANLLEALKGTFAIALDDFIAARHEEGARLAEVLHDQITRIEQLTEQANAHPSRSRAAILQKLSEQMQALLEDEQGRGLNEQRLHQEAAILATKADIREELDRLHAHVAAARDLIEKGGPVGRKFDFLTQEFNRESNTLCAKSNAVELTAIGLDLKAVVDQMREQVQNVE